MNRSCHFQYIIIILKFEPTKKILHTYSRSSTFTRGIKLKWGIKGSKAMMDFGFLIVLSKLWKFALNCRQSLSQLWAFHEYRIRIIGQVANDYGKV